MDTISVGPEAVSPNAHCTPLVDLAVFDREFDHAATLVNGDKVKRQMLADRKGDLDVVLQEISDDAGEPDIPFVFCVMSHFTPAVRIFEGYSEGVTTSHAPRLSLGQFLP